MEEATASLSDEALVTRVKAGKRREDEATAAFLADLGEMYRRRLHLELGFSSMTRFLVEGLGYSEDAAGMRTRVMNLAAGFPRILDLLGSGELHLSGLCVLAPHLRGEDGEALLDLARGKSRRALQELVAERAPKPPVRTTIRQVPTASSATEVPGTLALSTSDTDDAATRPTTPSAPRLPRPAAERPRQRHPKPLGRGNYKVSFTASTRLVGKLRQLEALLSHRIPRGDLPAALEQAVDIAIETLEKERFGAKRARRRQGRTSSSAAHSSRYVPAEVRRQVYERDGGRCTYESPDGRRCGERRKIELDHRVPFALGGEHTSENLTLRCRAHNQLAAVRQLGEARVGPRSRRSDNPAPRPGSAHDETTAAVRPVGDVGRRPARREC